MPVNQYRHSIYGLGIQPVEAAVKRLLEEKAPVLCVEVSCPDLSGHFVILGGLLQQVGEVIGEYFNRPALVSEFIAPISGRAFVGPRLYVRLVWRNEYAGRTFDVNNPINRLQIKDIYIRLGQDYRTDPLFQDALGLTLVD